MRWWAIAMTGIEASTSPPPLPRWFGPRASPDDPAVSALIARVARGAGWADIGGGFNLNVRIDAEPPVVLRVHRPWVRRGRVAGLRRLRERLQRTQVRVARPIRISGCDLLRVADRWAEIEEFIDHVQPRADEDSYVRLFEELGRVHAALKAVWEPSPPEPLDDHRTFGQLRYSVGFTRRRLGPRSEPVVHRMRQLTGELSKLRKEVELPCTPIHGDYKLGNAGELSDGSWATFDLDFARVRERLYDIAASLHHVAQRAELLEPRRLLDAYEGTAPEPLTRDEHRWLPGAVALIPLHWAATAGLVGDGIHEAESAMTAAEAWWSRRLNSRRSPAAALGTGVLGRAPTPLKRLACRANRYRSDLKCPGTTATRAVCPRHNASEIPRCVVQHVPVPFVDTPLTSNVREAVERDWSTNLNGPAVRLYGGEESAAFRVGDVGRRLGRARAPWACCARGVPRSPWPWRWQLIGTSRWCPVDGEIPPNGSASTRRTRPAGRPRHRGRTQTLTLVLVLVLPHLLWHCASAMARTQRASWGKSGGRPSDPPGDGR